MQEFRRFLRGPAGKILLALIIVPFIISGFYGYFTGGSGGDVVAEVEGASIHRQALANRVQQQRHRARQMLREQYPGADESMVDAMVRPPQVLDGMINDVLLKQAAREAGMHFSEVQAMRGLMALPDFQEEGAFSEDLFVRTVRATGQSPQRFISGFAEEVLKRQLIAGYQLTDFALPGELAEIRRLSEQRRDIRYLRMRLADLQADEDVDDAAVREYYEQHAERFIRPEQLRIQWLALAPSDFAERVEITDEDVQREYQARREVFESGAGGGEQRWASHLLLDTEERTREEALDMAESLRERLQSGEDFDELVEEYSDDAATRGFGGELGVIGAGDLPEPMEQALFDMDTEGQISAPVETDAGIHLIRLDKLESRDFPSLEELRAEIRSELARARADSLLAEAAIELEELAFEHSNLDTPADALDLEVQSSDWFALSDPIPLADHPSVREALASDAVRERGFNSELLELPDGRYVVVRVAERKPPEPIALEEVRDTIEQQIRRERAQTRLAALAEEAREAVAQGASLTELAEKWDLEVREAQDMARGAADPDRDLVSRAFDLPRPGETGEPAVEVLMLAGGDLVAMTLEAVRDGEMADLSDSQQREALQELASLKGDASFRSVMAWLRESRDIETWPERIDSGEASM